MGQDAGRTPNRHWDGGVCGGLHSGWRVRTAAVAVCLMVVLAGLPVAAQESADFYRQNCYSCHTIGGGRLVGPDLKDVTQRKEREWLARFILNAQAVINQGDPYAQQLLDEARGVVMPTIPGLIRERADALLDFIEAESLLEESNFMGLQIDDRPFTEADVALGKELFLGSHPLSAGGPACAACHTVRGLGGLSGGRLGPDLTKVYERVGGRKPLAAWLLGPATTTMRPVFKEHPLTSEEILPLVAYFEQSAQQPGEDNAISPLNFLLIGLLGSAIGLAVCDGLWRRRFRGVRRPLVDANRLGSKS